MGLPGIRGKVAILTGAGGGIGEAYARGLAAAGARVVVADIVKEAGERVAREIGTEALAVEVDVASPESTRALAERTAAHFGGIDFLVNNAAIYHGMEVAPLIAVDWDYYKRFMDVNMNGALLCVRACYESMAKRGGGAIFNQSSTAAWMSILLRHRQVGAERAHAIPGPRARPDEDPRQRDRAGTHRHRATRTIVPEEILKQILSQMPLARAGTPNDLVGACLFLLSDAAAWITGQVLNVDGGQIMRP